MANSELAHDPTMVASHKNTAPAQPAGDRLAEGATCGEYVVDRFLGAGAMGEVYAGRHPLIGKKVAIKILKRDLSASAEGAERFVREARAVNQVDHPNVIDVFAFGTLADGRLYLVMDFVDGKSLRQVVQDGPLAVPVVLDVLGQIADALDAAHSRGVVHRDLKPDNVMLSGDPPKVHVLDFGIAKLVTGNQTLNGNGTLTGAGSWLGTPGYMAPEQWSAEGAGPASDRYALGVMAFELLTGKLPFQAPTLPQMMEQHFRAPVPALATKRGAVKSDTPTPPATLDPVLARAMAKDPTKRFATAKELVAALREAAGGKRVHAGNRKLWMPAVAGAGVLGLAVVAIATTRGDRDKPESSAQADPDPAPQPATPAGQVPLEIVANPPGTVVRNGAVLGQTPYKLSVIPGEKLELAVKRLGYAGVKIEMIAPSTARTEIVELSPITGFRGTWRLKNGQLRKFERVDDHVMGYKLESLDDPGRPYRRFELVEPASRKLDGEIAWITNEITNEGPHPSCQVSFEVAYSYRQHPEMLVAQVGLVGLRKQLDGTCLQGQRTSEIEQLARVADGGDEIVLRAPVGIPPTNAQDAKDAIDDKLGNAKSLEPQKPPTKPIVDEKQRAEELQRKKAEAARLQRERENAKNADVAPQVKGKRPPNPKSGKSLVGDEAQQTPPSQQTNAPATGDEKQQKVAPPSAPNTEQAPQNQRPGLKPQPQPQAPPNGDAQILQKKK